MPATTYITGQSCRLPGCDDVTSLTRALFDGVDLVTEIPEDRWAHAAYLHPNPAPPGRSYVFSAGILNDLWSFDAETFGISPREAAQMDPQQRLLLQVVFEALEDAGLSRNRLAGQQVGVYVGASTMTHGTRLANDPLLADPYMMTGNTLSLVSNRISYAYDLRGPSLTVDTACSSSLFAFDLAEKALERGEIDTAIVAGANILLDPAHFAGFSAAHMLSPTGRSRPFSAAADGYARAEGIVAFVLERKEIADIAPRRPRAAILGVGTNSDGHTLTAALPALAGQTDLLRSVYERAGIDPATLSFVEAHGTGTAVGDPVEATALGQVLGTRRSRPLPIGSIKSNIGHLEPASGAAGVLKTLIAFEAGRYPATLHAEHLNPNIPFDDLNLSVVREAMAIETREGRVPRAGVSSFGFGGANAHMILEKVPDAAPAMPSEPAQPPILMVSAATEESLRKMLAVWSSRIGRTLPDAARLADLAGQASAFRSNEQRRAAVVCDNAAATAEALDNAARGAKDPRVALGQSSFSGEPAAFVFSGNGSQYAGMCRLARSSNPDYDAKLREIDAIFADFSGWSILARLESPTLEDDLRACDIAQPLLFADQVSQVAAYAARGLRPAAVMGHSGGEVAAAHVAGALSLREALALIHWRSISQNRLRGTGTMAALQVGADEAVESLAEFGGDIHLAAENSPRSVTLVGSNEAIAAYIPFARKSRRWACVKLDIDYPYHSPAQDQILEELRSHIGDIRPAATVLPFVSTVTGAEEPGEALATDYWCDNVRRPVNFRSAMATLKEMGLKAYLEIGPSSVLINYIKGCIGGDMPDAVVIPGFEKQDTLDPVGRALARALVHGCGLTSAEVAPKPVNFDRSLPRYAWMNRVHRVDQTSTINRIFGANEDFHRFLGIEDGDDGGVWRTDLDLGVTPEIGDHRVGGQVLFPATAFVETALAAALRKIPEGMVELRDLDILAPLRLAEKSLVTMRTAAEAATATVKIETRPRGTEGQWRSNVRCRYYRLETEPAVGRAPDPARKPGDVDGRFVYEAAQRIGLDYGDRFRRLSHMRLDGDDLIEVILDPAQPIALGHRGVNVAALDLIGADAVFHGLIGAMRRRKVDALGYLPVRVGRVKLLRTGASIGSGRIAIQRVGHRSILANFELFGTDGRPVALLAGVRFQAASLKRGLDLAEHAYRFVPQILPSDALSPRPAIRELTELVHSHEFSPGDEGAFLVEGIAQQIVLSAARGLANQQCVVPKPADGMTPYFMSAMNILVRAGLAQKTGSGWQLTPQEPDAPIPAELVASLAGHRPDLGAEAAVLARLTSGLRDFLKAPPESAREALGRDALTNISEGSVFAARRTRLCLRLVEEIAAKWPKHKALRIAEINDGRAQLLADLADKPALRQATLAEIVVPSRGEAGAAVALPLERVERIEASEIAGQFDLVIVPGTLDRAKDSAVLVSQLAEWLAPGGMLVATAQAPSDFDDLVNGLDPDWFESPGADGELPSRRQAAEELGDIFGAAGFADISVEALPDGFGPAALVMASRPDERAPVRARDPELESLIEALVAGQKHPLVTDLPEAALRIARPAGGKAHAILFGTPEANGTARGVDEVLAARLLALRDLAAEFSTAQAMIVAILPGGSGQGLARATAPLQVATWKALRVLVNEYPAVSRLAVDTADGMSATSVASRVTEHLDGTDVESEIILTDDAGYGLRVVRGLPAPAAASSNDAAVLVPPATGGLNDLHWATAARRAPEKGEVEIEVAATGLNYRDVMWAMGLLPEEALEKGFAGPTLGMEFSGRVVRCGAGVSGLEAGDKVVAFGPASFASHRTLSTRFVAKLPGEMDLEAAAAIPVAFFTAHFALVHLGRLAENETVLVHGAAGGVGLAAIQIAQSIGARVIGTAGSPVKRALLETLGVSDVLDSRHLAFADQVMDLTNGRGVDVVLNSVAGEAMEKSLNCLAPFGRFLELGKLDYYANTMVGLRPMKENISYFGIDVDQLIKAQPELSSRLFSEMLEGFRSGKLRPVPYRGFDGGQVTDAFRLMQKSGHIGKIVVRPQPPQSVAPRTPGSQRFAASPEGFHLVFGGLGGLGFEVAEWLIARGARSVVLVGRNATPGPDAVERIAQWRAAGVDVTLAACDIADENALDALLEGLRAKGPIRGVFHSAMVLEDMPMSALTKESLRRTLPAKVSGAGNLDRLTRGDALDYFVLFSSVAAMFGNHGQSAYAAANGYLEGIATRRRAEGLPGLAVGWGAVTDAGYLARDPQQAALIKRATGDVALTVREVTEALETLLAPGVVSDPVQYVSNMRWGTLARTLRTLSEPSNRLLRALSEREGLDAEGGNLRTELEALPLHKAEARLTAFSVERIADILRVSESSIKTNEPIGNLGMDSLMGVEFALAMEQALGEAVPVSLISDSLSINQIARNLVAHLRSENAGADGQDAAALSLLAKHAGGLDAGGGS
ncbi:MAG: SDR family NAD(P)-dependent oxidoreductase [Hyphomicrobiaceae bacterium]|nr:SDR family NAD(P)-dependent oxidoreductase [Hyphomicrobiaceae bacterium]